jgi:hypothetical protein
LIRKGVTILFKPSEHSLLTDEVSSTNTMACPGCREIIMASATMCRFCGLPIDAHTAAAANAAQQALNSALIQANALKYAGPLAALAGIVMILAASAYFVDRRIHLFWLVPPIALFASMRWFHRHAALPTSDVELLQARRDVQRAVYVWVALMALELLLLAWVAGRWWFTLTTQPN